MSTALLLLTSSQLTCCTTALNIVQTPMIGHSLLVAVQWSLLHMTIVSTACAASGFAGLRPERGLSASSACIRALLSSLPHAGSYSLYRVCPSKAMLAVLSISASLMCALETFGPCTMFPRWDPAAWMQELAHLSAGSQVDSDFLLLSCRALVNQTARSAGQKELFVEGKLQAPMPAKAPPVPATAEVPHIVTTAQVLPAREGRPGADLSSTSSSGREQLEAGTSSLLSRLTICRAGDSAAAVPLRIGLQKATPAAPLPRPSVAGGRDVSSTTCSWEGLRVPMRLLPQPVNMLLDGEHHAKGVLQSRQ